MSDNNPSDGFQSGIMSARIAELEALNVICALNTAETMKRAAWRALASGKDGEG